MKVTVRRWKLTKGENLYLDIYDSGQRFRENLGIVLDGNKTADAEKLRMAEILRSRRELELLATGQGIVTAQAGHVTLVEYAFMSESPALQRSRKRLQSFFGNSQLRSVTVDQLERYQKTLQDELANSTVETYINALVAVFNRAVRDGLLSKSPAVRLKRVRADERPPASLTDAELDKLSVTRILGEAGFGGEVKRAFLFACMTGLRISDLRALTWAKVRISKNGRQVEATQIKTGNVIDVPLNNRAWTLIDPGHTVPGPQVRVFPYLASRTEVNQYTNGWGLRAGVGAVHFHQSRHTFPRFLLEQGVDLVTVQNLMGHKKIETTARYGKASSKELSDAVKRLDRA